MFFSYFFYPKVRTHLVLVLPTIDYTSTELVLYTPKYNLMHIRLYIVLVFHDAMMYINTKYMW